MVSVVLIDKFSSRDCDGDWDSAVDYRFYEEVSQHFHLEIESVPVLITLKDSWVTKKYYRENEETGRPGPDMIFDGVEKREPEGNVCLYDFEWPEYRMSFTPSADKWSTLVKNVEKLEAGEQSDIVIHLSLYRFISAARFTENLHDIFTKHIPDYQRYGDDW